MRVLGRVSRFTVIHSLGNDVYVQLAKLLAVRALSLSLSLSLSLEYRVTCASKKRDMRSGDRSCDCDWTRATSQSVSLGGVAREPAERNRVGYTLSPDIRLNISLHPSNLWTSSQARSRY